MLRSVSDLLRYIDENRLTSDFTAKVEYCQSDWIVLRTVRMMSLLQRSVELCKDNMCTSYSSCLV